MPSSKGEYLVFNNASALLRSSFHSSEFSIQWTIEDFCFYGKTEVDFVESPKYYFEDNNSSWWLKVFPYHRPIATNSGVTNCLSHGCIHYCGSTSRRPGNASQRQSNIDHVSVSVHTTTAKTKDVKVKLCLIDSERKCTHSKMIDFNGTDKASCPDFVIRAELLDRNKGLLANGSLTLSCEIKILGNISHLNCGTKVKKEILKTGELPEDLTFLLYNSLLSDVTLTVARSQQTVEHEGEKSSRIEKTFKLHKTILASRSNVFAAMFSHGMKEEFTNIIRITDVEEEVMEEVIRYIYTDTCLNLKSLVADILPVAEKYNLVGLKHKCGEELYAQLTIENASQTLVIADMYNLVELKEGVMDFISANAKSVMGSPSWTELEKLHRHIAAEVFECIVKKQICGSS